MSSIPVSYSKSGGVLSCVSIIAQSCAIDEVYLISRLHNALSNCYFLSKLFFQSLYFLKVLTYTLQQELFFQRIQFFKTANLVEFLDLKVSGRGEVHRIMHYSENLSIKYHGQNRTFTFTSKLLSQGTIEQDQLLTNAKKFCFEGI